MRTGSKTGAIALLFSSAVMLFVLLFGGAASADEAATTANAGAAGANTGGNAAGGNASNNGAKSNQAATSPKAGDDAVASDSANSGNSSNGSASVTTGDANATGNSATNNVSQTTVQGHNGVVSITDQNATVVNIGVAGANTGGNTAIGNGSVNNANANQTATATGGSGDAVATNDATVHNDSGGDSRIQTGDATATGSVSNNTINQSNNIDCPNCLGVVALGDQNATIVNVGIAGANTGGNTAVGNGSVNNAAALQTSTVANGGTGDTVAANTGTASTNSNGSAGIITGDATAVGNVATNSVTQVRNINAPGAMGVIVLGDQNATTVNAGAAIANTGLNTAVGNGAVSTSNAVQGAVSGAGPPADDAVASNDGTASTNSNGNASISTGAANAAGNRSTTNLTQALNVNTTGHVLVLADQNATVINAGFALANTGGNVAVGNASVNRAAIAQTAAATNAGKHNGDTVAANFGTASDPSNGSASIWTGNAAAAGNESTTNVAQAINVNSTGGLVLPDQSAFVLNAGIGIANSGLNVGVGNASTNVASAAQNAQAKNNGDDIVASNFGDATTTSNGSASVTTGNADSIGNASGASTNISQSVDTNGADMVLADQSATSINFGAAASNTGLNAAIGNASVNNAATTQTAKVQPASSDAVASNFGDAVTESDGSASITTGNANAVGSEAHTNIAQSVNANGAKGFLLSDQSALAVNVGVAAANTGLNLAVGNAAVSAVAVAQLAQVFFGGTDDAVAANFGTSKTKSNGSASIHTGNSAAVGSRSTTNIAQAANIAGAGFSLPDQSATAVSVGVGISNTGGNIAVGNASVNNSALAQTATLPNSKFPKADDLVASNDGTASTQSNGSAEIWTGSANAIGNDSASTTNISQAANSNGAFLLSDQNATVVSVGIAGANSGLNVAVGNASVNNANSTQRAAIRPPAVGTINADDLVVSNDATASNNSDGSAKIVTGPTWATGNASTTNVSQSANHDGKGFSLPDQNATVVNVGIAGANSGLNAAVGNASVNRATTAQNPAVPGGKGNNTGAINADDLVAANTATTSNNSNGSATVITGASTAVGSASTTTVNQAANTNITGNGFSLADQNVNVVNFGAGVANSGVNAAVGNASVNNSSATQVASIHQAGPGSLNVDDVAAVNDATNTNESNGSASITTGATDATGNKSTTTVNQAANTNITGSGFTLNDQNAVVVNAGVGIANSGINAAIGNGSVNTSASTQTARISEGGAGNLRADDVVASNNSEGGNTSDGTASISTGAANAIGNDSGSTTVVNQASNTNIAGSGFALVDQNAFVANVGLGVANSGLNLAVGNGSVNRLTNTQVARISETGAGNLNIGGDAVAANDATQWNQSTGSASIQTGDAVGTGNRSTTVVNQVANNNIDGHGFDLVDNATVVVNAGAGIGNSGLNLALGNASQNVNNGPQTATVSEAGPGNLRVGGDAVASNTASLSNNSDGHASIKTGVGCGFGNISTTETNATTADDSTTLVLNLGVGVGNSGLNAAVGNGSVNTIRDTQTARFTEAGAGNLNVGDDVVAANTVSSSNQSNGNADIATGGATGYGNTSTTVTHGDSLVVNLGIGLANTGLNIGVGNASTNTITSSTTAGFTQAGPGSINIGDDGVASNVITETNNSKGTVNLTTGDAYALGNRSATGTVNSQDVDTDSLTVNFGLAFANSGLNVGAGNTSVNNTTHNATATAPGGVASNVADLSNTSDGSATIHTGNANAFGNIASNATCQGIDFGPTCPQPVLPPLPLPCPCPHGQEQPPVIPPTVTPPTVTPPVHPSVSSLPNTGGSVEGLALLGLLLLAIGVFLRRKARTA
jgi:LPXTG-motif cell wall-anchored protein